MNQLIILKQVTSKESLALDKYLNEIGKLQLISIDEEIYLAKRIRGGDRSALNRLVSANLRFVVSVAKQYQNQGLSLADLINEGNLGLMEAAERFDETRGFKFISYAVWWVRQSILQALAEQARIVRIPVNKIGNIKKINSAFSQFEQEYRRDPTSDELAAILNITPKEVREAHKISTHYISMDAPLKSDDNNTLYDVLLSTDIDSPDTNLLHDSLKREINRTLSTLSSREADIIKLYYGLDANQPYSLNEIGNILNLTPERVRQLRDRALKRIKQTYRNRLLKPYLGE
ncbi:MAG: RNA polymerase sigma factor RpoD/SigA [Cytophagaceae bacterium]|jgi:RNA polymerase primary sigma factor|nr:RNA polymerase sigma factor RpoD/SigA [Cytophagaceae bacterium]